SKAWPLPTGLGGVIGDALLRAPAWVFGAPLSGATRFTIAILVGTATCVTLLMAAGFGLQAVDEEEEEEEQAPRRKRAKAKQVEKEAVAEDDEEQEEAPERRSFVSLGWLYHFLFAL